MDLGLVGRACIVTGATRGIGLTVARLLHREGADLLLVARDQARLAELADELGGHYVAVDVTAQGAAERIINDCLMHFARIDVLVNNCGTMTITPPDELTDADWLYQWQLNVMAPMRLMRLAAPRMAARRFGRIVNVSSSAAKRPSQANVAYSATKAAMLSVSRSFAEEFASKAVLINAITQARWPAHCGTSPVGWQIKRQRGSNAAGRRFLPGKPLGCPSDVSRSPKKSLQ